MPDVLMLFIVVSFVLVAGLVWMVRQFLTQKARRLRNSFGLSVVPKTDEEKRIARSVMEARIVELFDALSAVTAERARLLAEPTPGKVRGVELKIRQLRAISARVEDATRELEAARAVFIDDLQMGPTVPPAGPAPAPSSSTTVAP